VVGGVVECCLDKQGRILLPPDLRSDANLDKEVVLTGMIDWVEIWDKEAWYEETQATRDSFDKHEASLSKLGIF
jgi:MraZ protein